MVTQTQSFVSPDLETVRKIVRGQLMGYKAKVYLFGSRAVGKAHRFSDIDVAVLPLQPVPARVFAEIREALEESDVIYSVDLVNLSETDDQFQQRVLKEGVLWSE
ncbi:MAG: nucleotidyltransferase domain-containing protein [Chloroflexi bacterium CG_4_10_14_0_8_um_filter_57_5]|nr:MAG: nucleotidyltransferase domain-containing protein [Chloroflexi bacterium CG_4_10_14_0_8_um_filter_57_5]PJH76171.1 MAG: nucleotidyltransferase domain-containing protein [Anaerolineae bacterium CG_4_9_14_0_8_um_filter_58_9]